jgi:hypothetical protein
LKENPVIKTLIASLMERWAKRREYQRLIAEIESLNSRDLQELRADPLEMRRQAWLSVYGRAA